jgi:hypothetical protein
MTALDSLPLEKLMALDEKLKAVENMIAWLETHKAELQGIVDGTLVFAPADYRKQVLEEAAAAVCANCSACDGSGVYASNYGFIDQCEYCGRPMAAIGSLSASPQVKP